MHSIDMDDARARDVPPMEDKSAYIENVLRNAITARRADTEAKRRLIYEAAERALERSLGRTGDALEPVQTLSLRAQMQNAIHAIEDDLSPVASASQAAPPSPQPTEDIPMTNVTPQVPAKSLGAARSRLWLSITAVLLLAVAAGGAWLAFTADEGPANVPPHELAGELLDDTYASAIAKLKPDPQIAGYVDRMRTDDRVTLSGWVIDKTNYDVPVSVLAYAGEQLIGAAGSRGKRPDLKIKDADPDAAFVIAAGAPCPKGTPLNVIGVTSDGRYAPLKFFRMEPACP